MPGPWDSYAAPAAAPAGFGPKPGFQYEEPKAAADLASTQASLAHTQAETQQMRAQAPFTGAMAAANLTRAQADASVAQQKADEARAQQSIATMTANSDLHGEAYLQKFVPPQMQAVVRAYARGDLGSRSGGLSTSMLPIIQHAMNYDPQASGTTFAARAKMQADLAGNQPGTAGGSLRAMEQMVLHGANVLQTGEKLGNFGPGILGSLGNVVQTGYERLRNDPTLNAYEQEVKNYAPESQKGVAGSAGGVGEREERAAGYSPSMPQESRVAALQTDARMAFERMGAVNDQYKRLMGHDITDAMSPTARAAYDKIMAGGYDPKTGQPLHPADGWTPISAPQAGTPPGAPPTAGSPPPGWTGPSGPGAGPTIATGATRLEDAGPINKVIDAGLRSGMSDEQINASITALGGNAADPAQLAAARNYLKANPGYKGSFGGAQREVSTTAMQRLAGSPVGAFAIGGADAATAGNLDSMAGLVGGDPSAVRQSIAASAAASPLSSLAGNVVGGGVAAYGTGLGLGNLGGRVAAAAPRAAALLANPLAADTAYGAAYGAGSSDNNRLGGAIGGGVAGLAGGMFGRKIGSAIGARLSGAPQGLSPTDAIALRAVNKAGPDTITNALTEASGLGVPMTLADTDAGLRSLAGAAVRKSPDAAQFAQDALLPRARGQIDRLGQAVSRDLGPVSNIPQTSADLTTQAQAAAAPLYDAAYSAPGASSVKLDDLTTRPSMKAALQRAHGIAAEEGRDPTALGFDLDDQGNVTLNRVPSFQTLDYVKRGLDDTLEPHRNPITGKLQLNEATRAINATKNDLLTRIDAVNPDYKAARQAYAGPVQSRDALARGQDAFGLSPDELGMQAAGQSPEHLAQMQTGFRSQLMDRANSVRDSTNPFEATLGTPNARARIDTLYPGNPGNANLFRQRDLEQALARTNTDVIGGSQTAGRIQADKAFSGSAIPGMAVDAALMAHGGAPVATIGRALSHGGISDMMKLGLGKRAEAKAAALAPMLLNTDPNASLAAMRGLFANDAAYRDYINGLKTRRVGGMFGAGLGASLLPVVNNR